MACHTEIAGSLAIAAFLERHGFSGQTVAECVSFAQSRSYHQVQLAPTQGYCSITFFAGTDAVLQFRPRQYALNIEICSEASAIFGNAVPKVEFLGCVHPPLTANRNGCLLVFYLSRIHGLSLSDFRSLKGGTSEYRASLVRDVAAHYVTAWQHRKIPGDASLKKKLVGSSISARVKAMLQSLPAKHAPITRLVFAWLPLIAKLPWVLTHGDMIPANLILNAKTGSLAGLIDWAEAEWLPFGVGFYGLEELLGEHHELLGFQSLDEASALRVDFWRALKTQIPIKNTNSLFWETVRMAHLLGILLWHGIAFNNGDLNRVVRPGDDDAELQKLEAQLTSACSFYWPKEVYGSRFALSMRAFSCKRPISLHVRLRMLALATISWAWRLTDDSSSFGSL